MKSLLAGWALFSLLFGLLSCAPPHYSAEALAARHAQTSSGVVVKQSRGSFILREATGEEILFRTGELTEYIPPDYRSQQGDDVSVTYEEVRERSGRAKLAVLQLESLQVAAANLPLASPLTGTVVGIGKGSYRHAVSLLVRPQGAETTVQVYIPRNCPVTLDRGVFFDGTTDPGWSRLTGSTAEIALERVPIYRGNAYLYQATAVTATSP